MKICLYLFALLSLSLVSNTNNFFALASDEHSHSEHKDEKEDDHANGDHEEEEEDSSRFGPNKAILAAKRKNGFQLSEKAVKALGLTYSVLSGDNVFKVSPKSIVQFQNEIGVYRLKDGWYKLIEVTRVLKETNEITIKSSELKSGDQIVFEGVPLLRVAELEAWGGSGDGHGH